MNLNEQVAVITAAASGIGLALAKQLLAFDAKLVLIDINKEFLEREFADTPQRALLFCIDITNQTEVKNAIDQAASEWGRIDILVNCAGITGVTNISSHEVNSENLHHVFEVNFMASF